MIGESYTSKAQARALGLLSTAWGVGAVMGEPCSLSGLHPNAGDRSLVMPSHGCFA